MAVFNLKLLIVKVGKLDVCGRPLFANPVTYYRVLDLVSSGMILILYTEKNITDQQNLYIMITYTFVEVYYSVWRTE